MIEVVSDGRDIFSRIAFSSQIELSVSELRVLVVEVNEEVVEVDCHLVLSHSVVPDGVSKTEASSKRLINEHYMGIVVPSELVFGEDSSVLDITSVIFEIIRTHLCVHTDHRGATRTSLEPNNERVNVFVSSRLSQ